MCAAVASTMLPLIRSPVVKTLETLSLYGCNSDQKNASIPITIAKEYAVVTSLTTIAVITIIIWGPKTKQSMFSPENDL